MINIVVPMAGEGARFKQQGFTFPKPLIEIKKKPMIHWVVKNITPKEQHRIIFICLKSHFDQYALRQMLPLIAPDCRIVPIQGKTEGAACTVMLASDHFNNDDELVIANGDQFIEADINEFIADARKKKLDGSILTFDSTHPKWSYARVGEGGYVTEVAEKKPISTHATVGIYYYRRGKDFFQAASAMIDKDVRVNGEFYVCPVYNQMIDGNKKVGIFEISAEKMHGLGTPEDLAEFKSSPVYAAMGSM